MIAGGQLSDHAGHVQRRKSVGHNDPRDGTAWSSNSWVPFIGPLVELQVRKPTLYPATLLLYPNTLCLATNRRSLVPILFPPGGAEFGMVALDLAL